MRITEKWRNRDDEDADIFEEWVCLQDKYRHSATGKFVYVINFEI